VEEEWQSQVCYTVHYEEVSDSSTVRKLTQARADMVYFAAVRGEYFVARGDTRCNTIACAM
jgi:hypothetical protein